jgi:hypothetical protein
LHLLSSEYSACTPGIWFPESLECPRGMHKLVVREIQLYHWTQVLYSGVNCAGCFCLAFSLHGACITYSMIITNKCRDMRVRKSTSGWLICIAPYQGACWPSLVIGETGARWGDQYKTAWLRITDMYSLKGYGRKICPNFRFLVEHCPIAETRLYIQQYNEHNISISESALCKPLLNLVCLTRQLYPIQQPYIWIQTLFLHIWLIPSSATPSSRKKKSAELHKRKWLSLGSSSREVCCGRLD